MTDWKKYMKSLSKNQSHLYERWIDEKEEMYDEFVKNYDKMPPKQQMKTRYLLDKNAFFKTLKKGIIHDPQVKYIDTIDDVKNLLFSSIKRKSRPRSRRRSRSRRSRRLRKSRSRKSKKN